MVSENVLNAVIGFLMLIAVVILVTLSVFFLLNFVGIEGLF
ncbi:hypothetical protein [Haloarchaeobius sp. HRN-SO-5]